MKPPKNRKELLLLPLAGMLADVRRIIRHLVPGLGGNDMYVSHRDDITKRRIDISTAKNVEKQVLVGPQQGWDDYVMRMFTLGEGGFTPLHDHNWPHIIYVVEGEGLLHVDENEHRLKPGSTALVPGGATHQFRNTGATEFVFICMVPKEGDS
ncbi:MAG: cupin domain-containing protein [Spirochaetota bacterium]